MFSELTVNESSQIEGGTNWQQIGGVVVGGFGIAAGIVEIATGAGAVGGAISIYCGVESICGAMNW